MAEYLGKVYLGGLYENGNILTRPSKAWRNDTNCGSQGKGNIPSKNDSSTYNIGNTPSDEAKKLSWHKIKDGNKTLLICDRNILVNVSWEYLDSENLVSGKVINIDGKNYIIRLLTGGTANRVIDNEGYADSWSGGSPTSNEWDRFIVNEDNIIGISKPTDADLKQGTSEDNNFASEHNEFWNWACIYSWCQDTYSTDISSRVARGYETPRYYTYMGASTIMSSYAWRPVLEEYNSIPTISGTDNNIGDKNTDFTISYTIDDVDSDNTLIITESIDGVIKNTINNAVRNNDYTINIEINKLSIGSHTVVINVSDGEGGTNTRTFTFNKINTIPTISGTNQDLGDKNSGFQIKYIVNDDDSDNLIVTEKLGNEVIRTINNVTNGQELTIDITLEKLYTLELDIVNTITIKVDDNKGGVAYRTYTFKRVNTKPIISGKNENLGQLYESFFKNFTVDDIDLNDSIIVKIKLDDEEINNFIAIKNTNYTVNLENIFRQLKLGEHTITITATDSNNASTIRTYTFEKINSPYGSIDLIKQVSTSQVVKEISYICKDFINIQIEKDKLCILASNNPFDDKPIWEEVIATPYRFKNKISNRYGIGVRLIIERDIKLTF